MLFVTTLLLAVHKTSAFYSNETSLSALPDDSFHGMPVYFKSNLPLKYNKDRMRDHIQRILRPLTPYILNEDVKLYAQRREDTSNTNRPGYVVQLEQYDLPFIAAAQIGTYTFSCRQTNGDLVVYNPGLTNNNQLRSIPSFTEFQIHPRPGVWWWVLCVTFETGGSGMGITGVQKPNPNALKSLVG